MTEIISFIQDFETLLRGIFYLVGILIVIQSVRNAARRSELGPQLGSWISPVMGFCIGILLIALPETIAMLSGTFFGRGGDLNPRSIFEYDQRLISPLNGGISQNVIELVVLIVQFLGFLAIIRSLLLFNQISTQGSRVLGPGFTFLVAGTLAVNFPMFWGILVNLFLGVMGEPAAV